METGVQGNRFEATTTPAGSKISAGVNWEEFRSRSLQPGGFGSERKDIWPRLLNVKFPTSTSVQTATSDQFIEPNQNDGDTKEDLSTEVPLTVNATKPSAEHRDEHQIKLDTDRSFVLYPEESETRVPKDSLKSDLNHLIVSIFRNRPKLNYFQGYHDIMTVIYLTLPQELHLACAEKLSLHRLRDSMLHSLEPVLGLLRVLKNLMRVADPEYAKLLERDSPLPFYALSNLLTLFSHDMPTLPLIQHVFDYLLCRPPISVVYLAAAILLSRREYIQSMEGQLEPFMFHPILSSLPPLTEGFELQQRTKDEFEAMSLQPPSETLASEPAVDISTEQHCMQDTRTQRSLSSPSPVPPDSFRAEKANKEPISGGINGVITRKLPGDKPSRDFDALDSQLSLKIPTLTNSTKLTLSNSSSPQPSPMPSRPPSPSRPSHVKPRLSSSGSSCSSPGESSQPPTNPIPLTSILSHSDSLYAQYPPSHPSLRLLSIMGPQSVVFTWSENISDLPSDTTAEAMVGRPELVVYPVGPEELEGQEESGEEESTDSDAAHRNEKEKGPRRFKGANRATGKKGPTTRHNKRKTIKKKIKKILSALHLGARGQGITQVDGRTMVAGTVIVLGVAMALYGIKTANDASEDIGVHFLSRHLPAHSHRHLPEEIKKIAGVLVGVGAKFLGGNERAGNAS